jgi:tRNA nucleotidyltransferase (CCA-adding enzyme)
VLDHHPLQVPVADSVSGEIMGIVTRTDLLRSLAGPSSGRAPASLEEELERALPPRRLALLHLLARHAETTQAAIYLVGGFVRDLLLEKPGVDYDLVVEGDAIALARRLAGGYGGRVSSHGRFGTAKWHLDEQDPRLWAALGAGAGAEGDLPRSVDFVSARTEFYTHPTALPSVRLGSIKLDLHRRDFSINTLALRLDGPAYGQLLDPWGGGRDVRERKIRVLHSISFIDDPTRILRAARLEQRLGFDIEPRTLGLLHEALPLLHRVSGERLQNELELIFQEPRRSAILARLDQLGVLEAIHPALTWDTWLEERFATAAGFRPPPSWRLLEAPSMDELVYLLWLVRLEASSIDALLDRFHMSLAESRAIRHAARLWRERQAWHPTAGASRIVAAFEDAPETSLVGLWLALGEDSACESIARYLETLRFVHPTVTGDDLRALGMPPGPAYSRVLHVLRQAWLDGQVTDADAERRMLEGLLEKPGG